jgi:hypothetical protein
VARARYATIVTQPTTTVRADDDVRDFSSPRRRLRFRVDDDVFEAVPDIAAEVALDYADKTEQLTGGEVTMAQQKQIMHDLFRMVLLPESADRFIARLSDRVNPIGQKKINDIASWLFEEYGLRPTSLDSASSTGSGSQDAGTSSTVST